MGIVNYVPRPNTSTRILVRWLWAGGWTPVLYKIYTHEFFVQSWWSITASMVIPQAHPLSKTQKNPFKQELKSRVLLYPFGHEIFLL